MLLEAEVRDALLAEFEDAPYVRPSWSRVERSKPMAEQLADAQTHDACCLVPARMDTRWWRDYCRYAEVRFLRGRVRLDGQKGSPPFPSAVVIFGLPESVVWWDLRGELDATQLGLGESEEPTRMRVPVTFLYGRSWMAEAA